MIHENKIEREDEFFVEEDFFKLKNGQSAVIFRDRLLFFSLKMKASLILIRRMKSKIDKFVNLFAYIIVVAGFLSFFYWIFLQFQAEVVYLSSILLFWQVQSPLILFFLISLFFLMFVIYRTSEAKANLIKIRKIKELNLAVGTDINKRPKIDISKALDEESLVLLENAYFLARKMKQKEIGTLHLFYMLCHTDVIKSLLSRLNVHIPSLLALLKKYLANPKLKKGLTDSIVLSDNVQEILLSAFQDAYVSKKKSIGLLNIVLFCYRKNELLKEILFELEVSESSIINTVKWFRINEKMVADYKEFKRMARLKPGSHMNKAYTAIATPTLDYFSRDLTAMAKYGYFEACVARDKELNQILSAFESQNSGSLLVGPVGAGKRTVVEGLAQLMVKEEVPNFLRDKRLVEIDVSRLISGVSPAQAEQRLLSIIHESVRSKNIVLYIENLQNMMGISAGSEESLELSEVLAESLSRYDNLYCIASVNLDNYVRYVEGRAIANAMNVVKINEPDIDDAIYMIESKVAWVENKYGMYFDYHAIEELVNLSNKYITDKYLPDKAVSILKAVAVRNSKLAQKDPSKKICTKDDIAEIISEISGIPVSKVGESEGQKLMNLEEKIHERMIGQEEAVIAVAGSLRRARAQMREGNRPISSFLFLGPTGVGKTELAKSVAEVYFGNENYMIRLDMSEYQLASSVNKMIGDVDGSLGYLTEAVRKNPFSLILFDEIEKAHPDILNLFLQILDDGRLTDGQGRTISFNNCIIITTSNAGSLYIQEAVKKNIATAVIKQALIDEHLNKVMRPELINRFDGIIVFKPLTVSNVFSIAQIMMKKIAKNLDSKGIALLYDDDGLLKIAKEGYDPKFGARPLRRLLQDKVENEIANLILSNDLKRRDTVFIDENANVQVEKAKGI